MKAAELLQWEIEYAVGEAEVDAQHKELMYLINDLINHSTGSLAEGKKYFAEKGPMIGEHAITHFETEEKLLIKTSYKNLEDHKKEHENLTSKIVTIQNKLSSSEDVNLFNLTVIFREWFLTHILLYDIEAKDFFRIGSKD